jgi:hypothetical protein
MKKNSTIAFFIFFIFSSFHLFATDYTFNVTSGNWDLAANWLPNTGVPGLGDNVTIPVGKTVLLSHAIVCSNITVNGTLTDVNISILTISQNLTIGLDGKLGLIEEITIQGNLIWIGGDIFGTALDAPITVQGTTVINTSSTTGYLYGRQIIMNGGGTSASGNLKFENGAQLVLPAGQTFTYTATSNGTFDGAGHKFEVLGTFIKEGSGTLTMSVPYYNYSTQGGLIGATQINAGKIKFAHNAEMGNVTVNTLEGIEFVIGTHNFPTSSSLNGTGSLLISNGTVNMSINLNRPLRMTGGILQGTFNTTGNITMEGGTFQPNGSVNLIGNLVMQLGASIPIFKPVGDATVSGSFFVSAGTIGNVFNTGKVTANGNATITGGSLIGKKLCLNSHILALTGLSVSGGATVNLCYQPAFSVTQQPTCTQPSGTLTVSTKTGVEYALNNSPVYQTSSVFSGLAPGNYTIKARVIGTNYLSDISQATINSPPIVTFDATKCYTIINRKSNKVMEVFQALTTDNASIVQNVANNGTHQQWQIVNTINGLVRLTARHSDKSVTTSNNGNTIYQLCYDASNRKRWQIECWETGYYRIKRSSDNTYLSIKNGLITNGADVVARAWNNELDQQWQIIETICGAPPATTCPIVIGLVRADQTGLTTDAPNDMLSIDDNTLTFDEKDKQRHLQLTDVVVFPNPANAHINIQFNKVLQGEITVSVINILGQKLLHAKENNTQIIRLDISNIPNGVYRLHIAQKEQEAIIKEMVIQK